MESMRYAYLRKGQAALGLILILVFAASTASADVSISNSYYTSGSESHENIFLHNMDYSNSVSVFNDNYNANAQASTSNQSETSEFTNTVYSDSSSGPQGFGLAARDSIDMGYSRTLVGGRVPYTKLTYDVENLRREDLPAALQINYFSPESAFNDNIYNLVNNKYTGTFQSSGSRAYVSGTGTSNGGATSSFRDILSYSFVGKDCKMDSLLVEQSGDRPVDYTWKTFLNQGAFGVTGIDISVSEGNFARYGIIGTSNYLGARSSPNDKYYPAHNIAGSMDSNKGPKITVLGEEIDFGLEEEVEEDEESIFAPSVAYKIER